LLSQAYDIDKPDAPADELSYYRGLVDAASGPVLEAMCGSGRFLVPLLRTGVDIDGIDASHDMLRACSDKCAQLGLSTSLELQRLEALAPRRQYGLIFCGGGSFGLISDLGDVASALHQAREALEPGGWLVFEVETAAVAMRPGVWRGRWWRRPDGALIVARDLSGGIRDDVEEALGIYELYVDGVLVETELNEWVRRFWTASKIAVIVEQAGFDTIRVTEAFGSKPATEVSTMISVAARRSFGATAGW
jgi:SAM-dependent methyltransferase